MYRMCRKLEPQSLTTTRRLRKRLWRRASATRTGAYRAFAWQWQYTTSDGNSGWTEISGATEISYVVTVIDVGRRLRVTVSYLDAAGGGTQSLISSATSKVLNSAPMLGQDSYVESVNEHVRPGTLVVQLAASDPDADDVLTFYSNDIPSEFRAGCRPQARLRSRVELTLDYEDEGNLVQLQRKRQRPQSRDRHGDSDHQC